MSYEDKPFTPDPLTSGNYPCTLTKIKPCELPVWEKDGKKEDGSDQWKKTDKKKDGLRFIFKVDGQKSWICKAIPLTTSNKGGLWKFIKSLKAPGTDLSAIAFNEKGWLENSSEALFWQAMNNLTAYKYMVQCEIKGEWTNFVTAMNTGELTEDTAEGHIMKQEVLPIKEEPKAEEEIKWDTNDDDTIPW